MPMAVNQLSSSHNPSQCDNSINNAKINNYIIESKLIH